MEQMKDKHKGKILNIVGKGPSLKYLKKTHFADGPTIALNESIISVEALKIKNAYSFQKDDGILKPSYSHLILNRSESGNCFKKYSPRSVIDYKMIGLPGNECSMIFAIQLGKLFGCSGFRFISFDMHTHEDDRAYVPGKTGPMETYGYKSQVEKIPQYTKGYDVAWITPEKDKKVSIIIPVIRPESAKKCMDAIKKNAGIPKTKYEIVSMQDIKGIGCPAMVKKIVSHASHDLIMFLGDDTLPEKDFLKHAIESMESLPDGWGVVGLNTQDIRVENGNPLAHWMAHRKILDHIKGGDFFSTEYAHCWCDNELKDIADSLGRWVWSEKSKITHVHPVNKSADNDEGYKKAYSEKNELHDMKTYYRRKRERMAMDHGIKLAIAVPLTDDKVYNQFLFSFVKVVTEYSTSLVNAGKQINFDIIFPDFPGQIDAIRNNLVQQALNLGCTHILMMDSDQIYVTDNLIDKMLAHDKPVIGARVHRRYPPFDPLLLEGEVGNLKQIPDGKIRDMDGNFEKELEVDYTGTGCIMYDMSIFNDMIPDKWFEFTIGEQGQPIGEDIGFCTKLKKHGIKIIVDCSIDIKHLTLLATDWGTHKLFSKILGGKKNGQ